MVSFSSPGIQTSHICTQTHTYVHIAMLDFNFFLLLKNLKWMRKLCLGLNSEINILIDLHREN